MGAAQATARPGAAAPFGVSSRMLAPFFEEPAAPEQYCAEGDITPVIGGPTVRAPPCRSRRRHGGEVVASASSRAEMASSTASSASSASIAAMTMAFRA